MVVSPSSESALAKLLVYAKPSDPEVANKNLTAVGLVKFPIDKNTNGMFTRSGEQVGVLGASDSVGQLLAALEDAVATLAAEKSNGGAPLKDVVASEATESETITDAEVDALVGALKETPSKPGDPKSPPLLSATDPAPQLRQALTHDVLERIFGKINDNITERKVSFRGKENRLLVNDVFDAFQAAGVDNVVVRIGNDNNLLITSGAEIIADDVTVAKAKDGTLYLGSEGIDALKDQLADKWTEALKSDLEQSGVRGEPPPPAEEVEDAVSEVEEAMHEGPGTTPEGPGEPVDPNGEGGSGGSGGEKK